MKNTNQNILCIPYNCGSIFYIPGKEPSEAKYRLMTYRIEDILRGNPKDALLLGDIAIVMSLGRPTAPRESIGGRERHYKNTNQSVFLRSEYDDDWFYLILEITLLDASSKNRGHSQ